MTSTSAFRSVDAGPGTEVEVAVEFEAFSDPDEIGRAHV
jgi:hypothetical protein